MKEYLQGIPPREPKPIAFSPGSFAWRGEVWTVATDAHQAMLVRGEYAEARQVPLDAFTSWTRKLLRGRTTLAKLIDELAFLCQPDGCDRCKDEGEIETPIMVPYRCNDCRERGETDSGFKAITPCECLIGIVTVHFGGRHFDAVKALAALGHLPDQAIRYGWIGPGLDPLRIDGDGWHYLLMPLRGDEEAYPLVLA